MTTKYRKYPKTMNLWFSQSNSSDDVWLKDSNQFNNKEVIVTSKIDGECTTLYSDSCHARSIDSMHSHHESRSWVKQLHASIKHRIPEGIRICGENVYAKHAIAYSDLPSYFLVFAVFDDINEECVSWDDTVNLCNILGLEHVPTLYRGLWDESKVRSTWPHSCFGETEAEGYVVRLSSSFATEDFGKSMAKWVRAGHVGATSPHWMKEKIVPNKLITAR